MPALSLVIIDDNREFREVLELLLPRRFDVEVRKTFSDAESALAHLRDHPADLVLVDYKMPDMNGIDFIRASRELRPPPIVHLVSFHPIPEIRKAALEAGATAVLNKTDIEHDLAAHLPPRGPAARHPKA